MHYGRRILGLGLVITIGTLAIWAQDAPPPAPKGPEGGNTQPQPPGEEKGSGDPKGPGDNKGPGDAKGAPGDPAMKDDKGPGKDDKGTGKGEKGGKEKPTVGVPGRGIKPPLSTMDQQFPEPPGANSMIQFGQIPTEVGGKLMRDWQVELRSNDPSLREQAVRAIASFGPNAREAVPQLIDRMSDSDSSPRLRAVLALKYLDYFDKDVPKVVEGFTKRIMTDSQASIRYEALMAMGRFGYRDGYTALPAVLKAAEDPGNWEIRRAAYMIMPRLGSNGQGVDSRVYKALMVGAKDPASLARHEAIICLAFLGRPNDPVLAPQMEKLLVSVLQSRDSVSEIWARVALVGYTPQSLSIHLPVIVRKIKDNHFPTKMAAVRAIAMLGPPAREAVPDLVLLLGDKNPELVISVCMAFTSMGSEATRAAEPLRLYLGRMDLSYDVRQAAQFALDSVTRGGGNVVNPAPNVRGNPR